MMPQYKIEIKFKVYNNVGKQELKSYIKEALESMGGCRHPNDPLFHSLSRVTVTKIIEMPKS